jgi:hypothetical protein
MHWGNDTVQFRITYLHTVLRGGTHKENSVLFTSLAILAGVALQHWDEGRIFRRNIHA